MESIDNMPLGKKVLGSYLVLTGIFLIIAIFSSSLRF